MAEQKEEKSIIHQLPNGFSFKLCWVEGGSTFQMGSDSDTYEDDRPIPIHPVQIPSFYIAEYPVTQDLWLRVLGGENPSYFVGSHRPVEYISWFGAAAFCNQLNLISGYTPVYFTDQAFQKPLSLAEAQKIEYPNAIPIFAKINPSAFRLPSEAEWEYAARGGQFSGLFTYAGGDKLDEVGWYHENSHAETKAVGLKLPNEFGICDMSGNVWEWCEDQFHSNYKGAPKDGSAWLGLKADAERVLRGGSWNIYSDRCSSYVRFAYPPSGCDSTFGFRVVLHSPPIS